MVLQLVCYLLKRVCTNDLPSSLRLFLQSGKLHLSARFLCFAALDKRSCRISLPLATIRRVEKIAAPDGLNLGAFALSLTLLQGARMVSPGVALRIATCTDRRVSCVGAST